MKRLSTITICAAGLMALLTPAASALAQPDHGKEAPKKVEPAKVEPPKAEPKKDAPKAVEPRTTEKTVESLRTAYWSASKAGEFYGKAAKKADEEGMLGVASLMRAAARVQSVHAAMFSKQLEALKSTAGSAKDAKAIDVKSTRENLAEAVKLATAARETDLPAARKVAEGDGVRDASKAFRDAREGEIELVRTFKDAAELSDAWKKAKKDFYVGRTCGYLVDKLDLTKCPVCGKGRDDFEKVN